MSRPRFKPLHSGAGFLCLEQGSAPAFWWLVSNPFIAGRDSSERPPRAGVKPHRVSNPFSAGRDSSGRRHRRVHRGPGVSNPFSAGRDSSAVHGRQLADAAERGVFQTPSARGGIPLSLVSLSYTTLYRKVSNPFSAGRDSSAYTPAPTATRYPTFQTPSARGGIPLAYQQRATHAVRCVFQTPSARGGIPLSGRALGIAARACVSNPFSAGRDSSETPHLRRLPTRSTFQTPSARGGIPLEVGYRCTSFF